MLIDAQILIAYGFWGFFYIIKGRVMARIMSPDIGTVRVTKRTDGPLLLAECVCSFLFFFSFYKRKNLGEGSSGDSGFMGAEPDA